MKASIVVPSRGGAARLPELLRCLRVQSQTEFEVIVVLDGDIDHSALLLAQQRDLRLRTIVFPENRGRVAALNAGFGIATGEVLIRCDDDLRPRDDYVERHISLHAGSEPVGVVGLYRNVYPETPYARVYGREADKRFRDDAYRVPPEDRWRYWAGNVSVTRRTFERVGPYDREYRAYGWEDVDWGYRLRKADVEVVLDPQLETDHHVAATTTAVRSLRAFHSGAARRLFESKHGMQSPSGAGRPGPWDALVDTTSRLLSREKVERIAAAVDPLLNYVPPWVGEKLVALCVESSARAGHRLPSEVSIEI